jgi:membrane protein implicated in regulation of membrane protease activity
LGLWIAERPWAYHALGLGTLFIEVLCPVGMLHWAPRAFFVVALASMQYGIYLTMGVQFRFVMLLVLPFIPWASLGWLARRPSLRMLHPSRQ